MEQITDYDQWYRMNGEGDSLWLRQKARLEAGLIVALPVVWVQLTQEAKKRLGYGSICDCWHRYGSSVLVVRELLQQGEISPEKLRHSLVGMLMLEWMMANVPGYQQLMSSSAEQEGVTETASSDVAVTDVVTYPASVMAVFVNPALIEEVLRRMIRNHYQKKPVNLSLIYCVLRDYQLIKCIGQYRDFVAALVDWGMIEVLSTEAAHRLADQISRYLRPVVDHGKTSHGMPDGFRQWTHLRHREKAIRIAAEMGDMDDCVNPHGVLHYRYRRSNGSYF